MGNLLEYARLRVLGRARSVMSIDRTVQGIDIRFHESARIEPERIVELVGTGDRITFVPPATLRFKLSGPRADVFTQVADLLREIA